LAAFGPGGGPDPHAGSPKEATEVSEVSLEAHAAEDNAPRETERVAEAEPARREPRSPPASLRALGPEPNVPVADVLGRTRRRAEDSAQASTRRKARALRSERAPRDERRTAPALGTRDAWSTHSQCSECRRRSDASSTAEPARVREHDGGTRGLARTEQRSRGDARAGLEDERTGVRSSRAPSTQSEP